MMYARNTVTGKTAQDIYNDIDTVCEIIGVEKSVVKEMYAYDKFAEVEDFDFDDFGTQRDVCDFVRFMVRESDSPWYMNNALVNAIEESAIVYENGESVEFFEA